ncbi:MAG: FecR family protein [bacterium]
MKRRHVFEILTIALFAASLVLIHAAQAKKGGSAALVAVKGTVTVMKAGATQWSEAAEKTSVSEGDTIRTAAGSSVIIRFADGSMTKLGPMASMSVSSLLAAEETAKTSLDVTVGKTWSRVQRLGSESRFHVMTPTAVAGVRGTYFSSEVGGDTTSQFDVFEGEVEVASRQDPSQAVSVKAHHTTTVAANQAPTDPARMTEEQEAESAGGFSDEDYTRAKFSVQVSVNPQVLVPGEKATVSIQVYKDDEPFRKEVNVKLELSGSAVFTANGTSTIEAVTDSNGALALEITDAEQETVNVAATLKIKVGK